MTKISHLRIHHRTIALKRPFVTAIRTAYEVDVVLVELLDTDGRSGWGEAPTSWRTTGESRESVHAAVTGPLWEAIFGADTSDPQSASEALERATVQNASARMALDCALYDLAAQLNDVPLFEYLGGHSHEVRTDVTLSAVVAASSLRDALEFAQGFVNDGVRTLKCKVGAGGDDVATLLQLRKALGPDVALRIDANQGWSPQQAVAIINDLQEAGVNLEFAEQPVARDDIDAMAFVTRHVQTPIMADETVWNRRNLREIVRTHAADMINVKLAKTGGLREARELVALAHKHDVAVIIGCMAESHVGISAAAALASLADATTLDSAIAHDLDGGLLLTRSPVEGGVSYDADRVILPSSPGTGITALSVE